MVVDAPPLAAWLWMELTATCTTAGASISAKAAGGAMGCDVSGMVIVTAPASPMPPATAALFALGSVTLLVAAASGAVLEDGLDDAAGVEPPVVPAAVVAVVVEPAPPDVVAV